jgi:hypothetical protein
MRAVLIGILWASACWMTEARDDLLSSPLWIWGWILVPVAAAALGRLDDTPLAVIASGVTVPMAVAFVIHGDPPRDPGPASWPIGVLLTVALGGICLAAARAGRATRPEPTPAAADADAPDRPSDSVG